MNPNQVHTTLTTPVDEAGEWTWAWACGDCPARSIRNYPSKTAARRVAAIHEDPSRKTQGSRAAATKNRKKTELMKKTITAAAITAAVLLLASCGTGKANEAVANAPRPTVTVTAPANPAPTVTTTATQNVATVPQSCLDALDNADQGFTYAGQILSAASQLDSDTMNAITDKLGALAPIYNTNKATCRAAGAN